MARGVAILILAVVLSGPLAASGAQDDEDAQATIAALQTQVAELESEAEPTGDAEPTEPPQTPAPAERPSETEPEAQGTVNVELILDVSGSMAQALDTGETRMDAAKRVLGGVVAAIPERAGVNVGLRIYGHEGDNSEASRAVSCASSELVVPVEGVEKADLEDAIAALQPTGWTPIALSLERAAEDFPDAGDDTTNAIVLVTDGLETCGGDPAAVAGRLRQGDGAIATHVIGFALTGEEQQLLAGIAEAGEGQLLGAQNADELGAALFTVLEELEIVAGTGYLGGNAFPLIPAGETGELAVVAAGAIDRFGGIPFVLRNNTAQDVSSSKVTVTARDAAGNLAGVANVAQVRPTFVPAGGLAFGYATFGGVTLPPDATFEFEAEAPAAGDDPFVFFRDLDIAEAALFEDRIVGVAENGHDQALEGLLFSAICFDLDGTPISHNLGSVDTTLEPGETQEFQVTILSFALTGVGCPAFLVAGTGY